MDGWGKKLENAQLAVTLTIDGLNRQRVKFGKEKWPDGDAWEPPSTCHDCAARIGQYHVPGCDFERCPKCGGQLISCGCMEGRDA